MNTGLTNIDVRALAISDPYIFAGTNGVVVFLSTNNGTSWTATNLGNKYVSSLAVSGTTLFVGAGGNGVWRRPLPEMITSVESFSGGALLHFSLEQNYPNPFNPTTKIKYDLPKSAKVKIEIFNLLGQKIETLLNKPMPSGSHEVEFTAKSLPSGVYLYRIEAGEFQQVKKMVLLK